MTTGTERSRSPGTKALRGPAVTGTRSAEELPRGIGLGTRLFLSVALLVLFTTGFSMTLATWQASRLAAEKIRSGMQTVHGVFTGYVESEARGRRNQLRSVAEESSIKALLAETGGDTETVHDATIGLARELGAVTVFIFDGRGGLIARSDRLSGEERGRDFSAVSWVRGPLAGQRDASAFILEVTRAKRLSLVASAPVMQGEGANRRLTGVVAAAFPMGAEQASELARLGVGEVAFVANTARRGASPELTVLASTSGLSAPVLLRGLRSAPGALGRLYHAGAPYGPFQLAASDGNYLATAIPILSGSGEPLATLVVARSELAELADFTRVRRGVIGVGLLMLVVSLPLSLTMARRVSKPIQQLVAGAEELRRGRFEIAVPRARRDELGVLAQAFAALAGELREKRELEDLVAGLRQQRGDRRAIEEAAGRSADAASTARRLEPGQSFGQRYEILSQLGEGGMGTVFRARDLELDEVVALKVLNPNVFDEATNADLLRKEIKIARLITHPNVVRMHDLGEAGGTRFLTMEFVSGATLRVLLGQRQSLELGPGLQIAKQVCRGLAAVHAAGIIHGDLKPENIMVMPSGLVKLMDFGVARGARVRRANSGFAVGTPAYMSPEHARGAELDERSDLYSAGVVMFEMFLGVTPFVADDEKDVLRMHLYEVPPVPQELSRAMPALLAEIILSCLAKARPERPATATDLERALMRLHI
jgi:HAMP domain-containing protein